MQREVIVHNCGGMWFIPLSHRAVITHEIAERLIAEAGSDNVGLAFTPSVVCLVDKASHGIDTGMAEALLSAMAKATACLAACGLLPQGSVGRVVRGDIRRLFDDAY